MDLSRSPGTYALTLRLDAERTIEVGRLGVLRAKPGYYVYVGSALGPGGLQARVARHCRHDKSLRWHIDYLTVIAPVIDVWWLEEASRFECDWSQKLARMKGASVPLQGFGASDCGCQTHLLRFERPPSFAAFRRRFGRSRQLRMQRLNPT